MLPAMPLRAFRLSLAADRPTALSFLGTELRASGEVRVSRLTTDDATFAIDPSTVARAFATLDVQRPIGRSRLVLTTFGGAAGGNGVLPPQELLYFGGPLSAPGYEFHELTASGGISQRVEWRVPVPFPSVNLGRFGRVPGEATLAPFVQATAIRRASEIDVDHPSGVYPSLGLGLQPFYDLLRLQVGRGLRHGRWTFNVDVSRDFWGIL
jgi:hemolysin activation/secretion protein